MASGRGRVAAAAAASRLHVRRQNGERTITLLSPKLHPHGADALPWDRLDETDAVYFTAGDVAALRQARRARVLVATARELPTLAAAGVQLDALVHSGADSGENYRPGDLDPPPRLVVATRGRPAVDTRPPTAARYLPAAPLPGAGGRRLRCGRLLRGRADLRARSSGVGIEPPLAFAARVAAGR